MRSIGVGMAVIASLVAYPAHAGKKPEVSGLALQQIQSRDYEVGKEISFPAVMTVLQDSGYRIQEADKDTGLVVGVASTKSATTYNIIWGFGKKKKTPVVSAFVEDRGRGSRIRLNFVLTTTKSRIYGVGSSDEEPIVDPAIYRDAFERIEKEIFVRQAMNAPAPRPISQVPTATADAAATATPAAAKPAGLTPDPVDLPSPLKSDPK
ncbi:hypothetical protein LZ518_04730 [Sphingomonas sp. RB56-2]|uniref:DUF4410 domain-containing protein n=1 Tax=Sphingomonas brevis TaxID=2908206 RepID=A0ABT0S8I1_9SPHN|nr:hypothetical protein [Sphingomonas brevis]MCL6740435.1 hypothetical protein [Sphingomonas brevis]